jgi:hypothetical protein
MLWLLYSVLSLQVQVQDAPLQPVVAGRCSIMEQYDIAACLAFEFTQLQCTHGYEQASHIRTRS